MKPYSINWDSIDLNRHASIIAKEVGCHCSNVMRRQQKRGIKVQKLQGGGATPGSGRWQKIVSKNPDLLKLGPCALSRRIGCSLSLAYNLCEGVSWDRKAGSRGRRLFVPVETPEAVATLSGRLRGIATGFGVSLPTALRIRKKFREGTLWAKKVVEA